MTGFIHEKGRVEENPQQRGRTTRPSFSSKLTTDRLRECERARAESVGSVSSQSAGKPRRSVFKEEGLHDLSTSVHVPQKGDVNLASTLGLEAQNSQNSEAKDIKQEREVKEERQQHQVGGRKWIPKLGLGSRPQIKMSDTAPPPGAFSSLPRVALIVMLIALVVPGSRWSSGRDVVIPGADAGVIREAVLVDNGSRIEGRADSPTDICTRWAAQIANVNGTVYIYGGQATNSSGETSNTWNNNFLTLDLTNTWQISAPVLSGLPQPSGPPAVAMGSLWHAWDKLWLYGGLFSDTPPTDPLPVATWEYDINAAKWTEYASPQTSAGNNSDAGGQPVQRAAEGAGLSVPELGRSWYFGGHLDMYTTPGWSNQIARVYLKSLLEYTHPGYANTGVTDLGSSKAAGSGGVYRNITEGGLQDSNGFTERADGVLVYVPGWGEDGIILGLAGGTNVSFTEMNIIDVYDIANSTWYKQATSGTPPPIRVDPCAVVAAALDGSSFNIYLYGGQNLIPYGSQIQYSDMWILTIPSFTWISVDLTGQSSPPARAGHSCTMWDGQLVSIGGYVGKDISCDSPGIYVFDASTLKWTTSFTALKSTGSDQGSSVLQGSVGYQVPGIVQSIIGGSSAGGATATTPAVGSATSGPIATGKPPTFTVTQSGSTVVQTSYPTSTSNGTSTPQKSGSGTPVGTIVAGAVAGVLAILAAYLAWCTWLYRRQIALYKDHVALAQRAAFAANRGSPEREAWMSEVGQPGAGMMMGSFVPGMKEERTSGSTDTRTVAGTSTSRSKIVGEGSSGQYSGGVVSGQRSGEGSVEGSNRDRDSFGPPSTANGSTDDLLGGQEPSFFSVVLNPRRTLRVVNSD